MNKSNIVAYPHDVDIKLSNAYNEGRYCDTLDLVNTAKVYATDRDHPLPLDGYYRYAAKVFARRGNVEKALRALHLRSDRPLHINEVLSKLAVFRFKGLTPIHTPILEEIAASDRLLNSGSCKEDIGAFLTYKGHALMKSGRHDEAEVALRDSIKVECTQPNHKRLHALSRCDLANCLRIRGEESEAFEVLEHARQFLTEQQYLWELYDIWLPNAIKLGGFHAPSEDDMCEGDECLQDLENPVGFMRNLLLRARGAVVPTRDDEFYSEIIALRDSVPDLCTCPLLKRILDNWEAWIAPEPTKGEVDYFWSV